MGLARRVSRNQRIKKRSAFSEPIAFGRWGVRHPPPWNYAAIWAAPFYTSKHNDPSGS